ncbi:hypothetical protein [Planctopirus hydrillae]|nr:hypothetical protein [Planctopirus hydrillae]
MQNYHLPPEMLPEGHSLGQNLVRTLTVIPNEPVGSTCAEKTRLRRLS